MFMPLTHTISHEYLLVDLLASKSKLPMHVHVGRHACGLKLTPAAFTDYIKPKIRAKSINHNNVFVTSSVCYVC